MKFLQQNYFTSHDNQLQKTHYYQLAETEENILLSKKRTKFSKAQFYSVVFSEPHFFKSALCVMIKTYQKRCLPNIRTNNVNFRIKQFVIALGKRTPAQT